MGPEAEAAAVLVVLDGVAVLAAVGGLEEAVGAAGAAGVGAVCAITSAMPEDRRMDEKKRCFIVRGGSGEILKGSVSGWVLAP